MVITSPYSSDGKTVTTANLGVALPGRPRVALVSADLRRPTLEKYFGINGHGPRTLDVARRTNSTS